jgi:hypothetical protein
MARTDSQGVKHISGYDEVTEEGDNHLLECDECGNAFPAARAMLQAGRTLEDQIRRAINGQRDTP